MKSTIHKYIYDVIDIKISAGWKTLLRNWKDKLNTVAIFVKCIYDKKICIQNAWRTITTP